MGEEIKRGITASNTIVVLPVSIRQNHEASRLLHLAIEFSQ